MCFTRKLYSEFPWVFDELYPRIYDYQKDFACYNALLEAHGVRRVLDLGCGTGLLARFLVDAGYDYIGSDISTEMLSLARAHVPGAVFMQCDMRDLVPLRVTGGEQFDAILCTGRSFAHLTSNADVLACLEAASSLLRPGGIFCCDAIDASRVVTEFREHAKASTTVNGREYSREFLHARLLEVGWTISTRTHFVVKEQGRVIADFEDDLTHRAFLPEELGLFLRIAGLAADFQSAPLPHLPSVLLTSACKVEV